MWQVVACLLAALTMWLSVIFFMRYLLKILLMYKVDTITTIVLALAVIDRV